MNKPLSALLIVLACCSGARAADGKVPMLYSTDLFHPHGDPDDHYDLATLFAIEEFDVKGIILDVARQTKDVGRPPVRQIMHITGRQVPYAVGLSKRLRSGRDRALEEPAEFQGAVELILSVLRASKEKVVITTTGSCRDVAVAFNRQPELLKEKVKAVYFNVGRGPNEGQNECNVNYDPVSYLRMFETGLPLYWCPCFGNDGYETHYVADQADVVGACARPVQNYFVYCLTRSKADPIAFLASGPHPLPTGKRHMWCTGPMFHAAGRKIYQRGPHDFVALAPAKAREAGLSGKEVEAFRFVPVRVTLGGTPCRADARPPRSEPGKLAAVYLGRTKDRVGKGSLEPDGLVDCCVRVAGLAPDEAIKNVVLTGPNRGRWESAQTGRWWRVACDRHKGELDCYFQFYAAGPHRIEIVDAGGKTRSAEFEVPAAEGTGFRVEFGAREANAFVFRSCDPRYQEILASCLKNLLAGLGR